jgi:hypothetical protein
MTELLAGNMSLAPVIGDLYMGAADFPNADELQERMRNWISTVNPGVMGGQPSPQEQQLMQHNQILMQELQRLQAELQDKSVQRMLEQKRVDMDALNHLALRMENDNQATREAYKAETDRLKLMAPMMTEDALEPIIRKLIAETMSAYAPDAGIQPDNADPANVYSAGIQNVLQPIDALKEQELQDKKDAAINNMTGAKPQ